MFSPRFSNGFTYSEHWSSIPLTRAHCGSGSHCATSSDMAGGSGCASR